MDCPVARFDYRPCRQVAEGPDIRMMIVSQLPSDPAGAAITIIMVGEAP